GLPEVPVGPGGWQAVPATPLPEAPSRAWTPRRRGETRRADAARDGRPGWGLLMLAGCVTLPVGPNVAVLPASEKPQEVFVADDAACRESAAHQTGLTQPHIMEQHELRSAVLGPLLGGAAGAALGAAFGAAAGNAGLGAATGAGAGLVLGTAGGTAAGS